MTLWVKFNEYLVAQQNCSQSDINNATNLATWQADWDFWVNNPNSTPDNRPPVKPPHP